MGQERCFNKHFREQGLKHRQRRHRETNKATRQKRNNGVAATLLTQSQVDDWGDCQVFYGSITISGNSENGGGLTNLEGMEKLRKVCGTVTIQNLDMLRRPHRRAHTS